MTLEPLLGKKHHRSHFLFDKFSVILLMVYDWFSRWIFAHSYPEHIERFISISTSHPNLLWDNLQPKSLINDQWLRFVQLPYLPEAEMTRNDSNFIESALSHLNKDPIPKSILYASNDNICCIPNKMDAYKYVFSRKSDWSGPLNYYRNLPFYKVKAGEMVRCPCLIVIGRT